MIRFIKKWPLICSTLLLYFVSIMAALLLPNKLDATLAAALFILIIPGIFAFFLAVARLFLAVCRKSLSYAEHSDAVLVLLVNCLLFLLASLSIGW